MLLLLLNTKAQPAMPVKTYGVGDTLPVAVMNYVLHSPALKNKISSTGDKWLILDFMATNCASCVEVIPLMDTLQSRFGKQLQIILITYQKKQKVSSFLQKSPRAIHTVLPVITEDSILASLFPHQEISHEVWIDPMGIVRAITTSQYVNSINIQTAIEGKRLDWPVKTDISKTFYNPRQPLLTKLYASVKSYSALIPFDPSLISSVNEFNDSMQSLRRFSIVNFPVISLYLFTYGKMSLPPAKIVFQVKDSARFVYSASNLYRDAWERLYNFCFEASFPFSIPKEDMQRKMREDLDFYLGLHARIEERLVPCYVVTDTAIRVVPYRLQGEKTITLHNMIYIMNNRYFHLPVIDERSNKKVLQLPIDEKILDDIPALQMILSQYGLALLQQQRKLEILLITEK